MSGDTTETTVAIDREREILVVTGAGARPSAARLRGPRASVVGRVAGRGRTWSARIPLRQARWGGPTLPLPSGGYRIEVLAADGSDLAHALHGRAAADLPSLVVAVSGHDVTISAPRHTASVVRSGEQVDDAAVFFESFGGRVAGCNPLAIDAELSARLPGLARYWSVVDLSVEVPAGAIPVIEGSADWFRARAGARLLVVNDWLRHGFRRRPGQRVLQTWHGTPLKRLALHRPGFDPRRALAVVRESRRWDVLLAQNPAGERLLRAAYAFGHRPVWVEGYPRNDILVTGDAARVRERLGIGARERVLLYAPTWRDDRERMVEFIDPVRLAERTGSTVLVRGHTRTLAAGADVAGTRVLDVTGFGDTSQLLLAADLLVTDYSSLMFDFSATGKPIYFLVPDLAHYRGELRGFYFDLAARAPGPVVRDQDALEAAIARGDDERYAQRYAQWRARFNARDDGGAAARVVDRILDQRMLDERLVGR